MGILHNKPPQSPFAQAEQQDAAPEVPAPRGPQPPASPFSEVSAGPAFVGWHAPEYLDLSERSLGLSLSSESLPPSVPAREPPSGPWRGGAQPADKLKPSESLRSQHSRRSSDARSEKNKHLPPVSVSALRTDAGDTYVMTQTLAQGYKGKFRICSKGTEFYAVKEYRLTKKRGQGHTAPSNLDEIVREWKMAAQHGGMTVHDVVVQDGKKILVITDLFDRDVSRAHVPRVQLPAYGRGMVVNLFKHLQALHEQRVLHGDIKPGNILLGEHGVQLTDFGHAEPLGPDGTVSTRAGTPGFITPESFLSQPRDAGSDAFSVAMTWFALLQAPSPFAGLDFNTVAPLFHTYEQWFDGLTDARGHVDPARIQEVLPGLHYDDDFEPFHAWGRAARDLDAPMLDFILNGPAHPNPGRRPAAEEALRQLEGLYDRPVQDTFQAAVASLRARASYVLKLKGSGERHTYPLQVIKDDLRAFAEALEEEA